MGDICDGLTVLELGAGSVATSMAGMVFADAGARVLKVEPPEGDRLRTADPSGFLVWNRGKESVVADLRIPAGQQRLRALAGAADVVLEGFAPGRTDGWGVGPAALRAADPGLVHCSFTGFGRTGDYARLKGYDSLVAAKVGLWARGAWGHRPGPIVYPVPWGSFGAAMQGVAGVLGALLVRERTGRGQTLDATLVGGLEPIDYFVTTIVQLMAKKGQKPTADARAATASSRYGVLVATRDGRFIQTSTLLPHQGRALTEVAGRADVLGDPRFARLPMFDSPEDAQEWEDLLLEAFRARDLADWLPVLRANPDIAFEVAVTSEEGLEHPQIRHNGDAITVTDPQLGPVRQVGPIGHFERTPCRVTRSAPALGAHAEPLPSARVRPAGGEPAPEHPFSGVTVVEFGCFYAMPFATASLAALGARVIKIEDPAGDPHRRSFGPEVASAKTTAGKESISLDLRTAEGRRVAGRIVAAADVFVTGFRSGTAEKLGLGPDELRALNPRLLYVHAAGYGSAGPDAQRALYAQAAQAVAGSFGRQVGYWADPVRNEGMSVVELQAVVLPRLNQIVDGDSNAALALLAALALGVYHQRRTGEGQTLRTSMIAGNALAYSDDFCAYPGKPPRPLCDDEYHGTGPLDRVYPAAEGSWVCLAVHTERERAALAETLELAELTEAALAERFRMKPAREWEATLSAAGVGCVDTDLTGQPMVTAHDPVLRATGLTVAYQHPLFGEMVRAAPPVAFSETPGRVAPPCRRGEQGPALLREHGFSAEEIDALVAAKVVSPAD